MVSDGLFLLKDDFYGNIIWDHYEQLLAIVKVFKTWKHYLEDYKHEILVLTDHKNL